jgi:hypothetical protein
VISGEQIRDIGLRVPSGGVDARTQGARPFLRPAPRSDVDAGNSDRDALIDEPE